VQEAITAWEEGQRLRIAIASPEHAPYGMAARDVLQKAGLWEASEPLRVQGENVSQAMQFALSDEARGGLVAYSLAVAPALAERSEAVLMPETWHTPLRQRMVLTPQAGEVVRRFTSGCNMRMRKRFLKPTDLVPINGLVGVLCFAAARGVYLSLLTTPRHLVGTRAGDRTVPWQGAV
jgi:hypothetical protein